MSVEVLAVVSEIYPLVKTGGLADVAGALPAALRPHDVRVTTLVPGYPAVMAGLKGGRVVGSFSDTFGGESRVVAGRASELDLLVLDAPHLFDRPGNPYMRPDGHDWPDNAMRFGALSWVAAQIGLGAIPSYSPDILHCHDWQSGLAPAYLAYDGRAHPPSVMTIHNLAFQGQFPADLLGALRLPPHAYSIDGVEYYGAIGFLKAGLFFASRITTVSPTYAREIQTPEHGFGMDGLLRLRGPILSGIVNGIDTATWDPATDPRIAARYDRGSLALRSANKAALQARFGLEQSGDRLLFGVVSRLTWQKGIDLLAAAVPSLLAMQAQLVVLGTGEADLERQLVASARAHPGQIGCEIGYDEDLAHLIQAGADALLVPSRFEPCGLTQLCAQRYGALPVVSKVGGLADTVVDLGTAPQDGHPTGIQFAPVDTPAFETALRRTRDLWADQVLWRQVQQNAMESDVSWQASAARYARLYKDMLARQD